MSGVFSEISIAAVWKKGIAGRLLALASPVLDAALGIRDLRRLYERDGLSGLDRFSFLERFIEKEGVRYGFKAGELARIPATGPVVIVSNHPMGGLEGIVLMHSLKTIRSDYKVFANVIDSFLKELEDFFIFANPMARGSRANIEALRLSREWLAGGHCLLLFPAGRVGLYRPEKGYVTDEPWDGLAASLALMTRAAIVPLFVEGSSSKLFGTLSRHIYPMKLLYLLREFLGSLDRRVVFHVGKAFPAARLGSMRRRRARAWLRMRCYLECPAGAGPRRRGQTGLKPGRGILHPEVEDYIERYGLSAAELGELAAAIGGEEGPALVALRELRRGGASTQDGARKKKAPM